MNPFKIQMVCHVGLPVRKNILKEESLGGAETALMGLAFAFSKLGHKVDLFCVIDKEEKVNNITFRPHQEYFNHQQDLYDISIFSRDWNYATEMPPKGGWRIGWLHDKPGGTVEELSLKIGGMWSLDEFYIMSKHQQEKWGQFFIGFNDYSWVTRNGIDQVLVNTVDGYKRDPKKLMFISSPERGLLELLERIWPKILKHDPEMMLNLCAYTMNSNGYYVPRYSHETLGPVYNKLNHLLQRTPNIVPLGSLTKKELYKHLKSAEAVIYPLNSNGEISCIAAMEAMACGTPFLTSGRYALPETLFPGCPSIDMHINDTGYTEKFIDLLFNDIIPNRQKYSEKGLKWSKRFDWNKIAKEWVERITEKLFNQGSIDIEGQKVEKNHPTVATCMIVKNEESHILGCLNSIIPYVDEIHITDTGSTDLTKHLIESYQKIHSNVFLHNYEDSKDFDDMRNYSVTHTECDWIFWIDADERLVGGEYFRKHLKSGICPGLIIRQYQLRTDQEGLVYDEPVRLYKNLRTNIGLNIPSFPIYNFIGAIHEHIEASINTPVEPVVHLNQTHLAHYGYVTEYQRKDKVQSRNMKLLLRDRQK